MNKILQELQKYAYWVPALQRRLDHIRQMKQLSWWREQKPRFQPLPHLLKQKIPKGYTSEYGLSILVETGKHMGEMVKALRESFGKVYSIKLSEKFAKRVRIYFRNCRNISFLQGDRGNMVGELIQGIDQPTLSLFWLDGHWSEDQTARGKKSTPIMEELDHILRAKDLRHVILIDDARPSGKSEDYPPIDELTTFVHSLRRNIDVFVEDDIIRILPQ